MLLKLFNLIIDFFVPDEIHRIENSYVYLKARILVAMLFMAIVICLITYAVAAYMGEFSYNSTLIGGIITVLTCGFFLLCMNVFKMTASYEITTHLFGFASWSAITIAICITDGLLKSPSTCILVIVPMMVTVLATWHTGLIWFAIVMVTYTGLFIADYAGVDFPSMYSEHDNDNMLIINLYVLCIFAAGVVYSIELYRGKMLSGETSDNRQRVKAFMYERCPLNELAYSTEFKRALIQELNYATLNDQTLGLAAICFQKQEADKPTPQHDNLVARVGEKLLALIRDSDYLVYADNHCYVLLIGRLSKLQTLDSLFKALIQTLETDNQLLGVKLQVRCVELASDEEDPGQSTSRLARLLKLDHADKNVVIEKAE